MIRSQPIRPSVLLFPRLSSSRGTVAALFCGLAFILALPAQPAPPPRARATVDLSAFHAASDIAVAQNERTLRVTWPMSATENGVLVLDLERGRPLIDTLGVETRGETRPILRQVNPVIVLTVGERDLKNPAGWVAFFDNPPLRPYRTFPATIEKHAVRVGSEGSRATITVSDMSAGSFRGRFQFTIFPGSALLFAEAILRTDEDGRAILYDAGLTTPVGAVASLGRNEPNWLRQAWLDAHGNIQHAAVDVNRVAGPAVVARRAIAAEADVGSVALFPPPHQYFYPLDFATNLGFAWYGASGEQWLRGYGFGVRQPPAGDKRWVPWCNAPPGTDQRLGVFYLVSSGDAAAALAQVSRYTRDDHYPHLPGYATFTSHYHIEHTIELTRKRQSLGSPDAIPPELRVPGFVRTFKARGVDIVHLAEFHNGETPRLPAEKRLPLLKTLHDECARLSDGGLLVLPGEEPDVHLGGHWISFFPQPVYWVLNRSKGAPFVEDTPGYGKVYHVGSADDVLKLMETEGGLMWTAHARIKGSFGYPDRYWDTPFFHSDRFLGAAWKSMPVDLSLPRLGTRVLDLQDQMANRGDHKYVVGEADIFRVEPDMETYAHLNINYLKLDRVPRFAEGWQPVLDALRAGRFFVSTGEIVIPDFTIGGRASGETLTLAPTGQTRLHARLEWTFPLAFAEIISGDGHDIFHQRIDLSDAREHGTRTLDLPLDLQNRTWARFEVWDVAHNGAFTPPVWLK